MPEATFVICVKARLSEEGANVNEILGAARGVRDALGVQLTEAVIAWMQEVSRDRLCGEDHGITQQSKMILVRRYNLEQWNEYWKRRLDLQDWCTLQITHFVRAA